ncbi:MAG TPA: lipoyl(octanoyl) transferase LipB, partial [Planctomycetota bacterium]|nr:lipoyl(octanoyl) transferase LipB [Planctomycetota bacterium]
MTRACRSVWLGRVGYAQSLELQRELSIARQEGRTADVLVLLEHPPVITLGKIAKASNLRMESAKYAELGIEVHQVDRGGDVTYHGPGQLVGYPIIALKEHRLDVKWYLERLEAVLVDSLAAFGLEAHRESGFTGAWIGERKIAAIGVRVEKWVTRHGFALNVNTDLSAFDLIIPCGIRDRGVTSIRAELG